MADGDSKIELNGKRLTESQFQEKKKKLEKKPGVKVVRVGENRYRTQIKG